MGIIRSFMDLFFHPKPQPISRPPPPNRVIKDEAPPDNVRPLHRRPMTGKDDAPRNNCNANCVVEKERPNLTQNEIWKRWVNER